MSETKAHCLTSPFYLLAENEPSTKSVSLNYSNLSQIVQTAFSRNRNISKIPVAVLNVALPAQLRPRIREIITEWVIHHLEKIQISEPASKTVFKCADNPGATFSGVYLWPIPYLLKAANTSEKPVLVWIIYGDASSYKLALFAKSAASVKFPLDTRDMDRLFASENVRLATQNRIHKQLDLLELVPAQLPSSESVMVHTLEAYLQWVADRANGCEQTANETHIPPELMNTVVVPAIQTVNISQSKPSEHTLQHYNHTVPKAFVPISTKSTTQAPFHHKLCEIYDCPVQLQKAETTVEFWINNRMTLENISDMVVLIKAHLKFPQQHGIADETEKLVKILQNHVKLLCNMFDNFVCFSGNQDMKQMKRFFEIARENSKEGLNHGNLVHSQFILALFEKCCNKIDSIFELENQEIAQAEEKLGESVLWKIKDVVRSSIRKTDKLKNQVTKQAIHMLSNCMDYSGKMSSVQGNATRKLEEEMESYFAKEQDAVEIPDIEVPFQHYVSLYNIAVAKYWSALKTKPCQDRKQLHEMILSKILENCTDTKSIQTITLHANFIFCEKNERLEQELELAAINNQQSTNTDSNAICVHLTQEWIQVVAESSSGFQSLAMGPGQQIRFPPVVTLTKQGGVQFGWDAIETIRKSPQTIIWKGGVLNLLCQSQNQEQCKEILSSFMKSIKTRMIATTGINNYNKIHLVIPDLLSLETRTKLRKACRKANFDQVYLVSETILGAAFLFEGQANKLKVAPDCNEIAVVFSANETNLDIKAFAGTCDRATLIATAAAELPANQNPEQTLKSTYHDVTTQIRNVVRNAYKIVMGIISEKVEMETCISAFLMKQETESFAIKNLRQENVLQQLANSISRNTASSAGKTSGSPEQYV